jgi:hypothetical protein
MAGRKLLHVPLENAQTMTWESSKERRTLPNIQTFDHLCTRLIPTALQQPFPQFRKYSKQYTTFRKLAVTFFGCFFLYLTTVLVVFIFDYCVGCSYTQCCLFFIFNYQRWYICIWLPCWLFLYLTIVSIVLIFDYCAGCFYIWL